MSLKNKIHTYKKRQFCNYMKDKYKYRVVIDGIIKGIMNTDKGYVKEEDKYYIPLDEKVSGEDRIKWYIIENGRLYGHEDVNKDICEFFNIKYKIQ